MVNKLSLVCLFSVIALIFAGLVFGSNVNNTRPVINDNSLVFWYTFEDGKLVDITGNGNHPTSGGVFTTKYDRDSIYADDMTSVNADDYNITNSDFTIGGWMRPNVWDDGSNGNNRFIDDYDYGGGTTTGFYVGKPFLTGNEGMHFVVGNGEGDRITLSNKGNIQDRVGQWVFVTAVFKGSTHMRLYHDDILVGELTVGVYSEVAEDVGELEFGAIDFDGNLDDLFYFARALSTEEIREIYFSTLNDYYIKD